MTDREKIIAAIKAGCRDSITDENEDIILVLRGADGAQVLFVFDVDDQLHSIIVEKKQ